MPQSPLPLNSPAWCHVHSSPNLSHLYGNALTKQGGKTQLKEAENNNNKKAEDDTPALPISLMWYSQSHQLLETPGHDVPRADRLLAE